MKLTVREQRALDAIRKLSKDGFPPSIDAVKLALRNKSSRSVQELINSLRDKGYLLRWPGGRQKAILLAPQPLKTAA
jgi:SOS-response transcriptional repressor LexA